MPTVGNKPISAFSSKKNLDCFLYFVWSGILSHLQEVYQHIHFKAHPVFLELCLCSF